MLRITLIMVFCLVIAGCSSNTKTIQTHPAEDEGLTLNQGRAVAADNHLEQGKALYFKGKYAQAIKHLMRSITNNYNSWESHYFLGLCQQKKERYDRSIGSFNNALKYCPPEKLIIAKITYNLGFSWEKEGYLHKAAEKYSLALKMNPDLAAAQLGTERIKSKTADSDKTQENKDEKAF